MSTDDTTTPPTPTTPPPTAEPRAENVALSDTSEPRAANVALSDTFADTENDDFDVRALEDEKAEHFLDGDELPQLSVPRNEAPVFRSGVQVVLRDDEAAPGTDWLCCGGGGGGVNDITAAQLCMGSGPGMTYDDAMIPPPGAVLGSPRALCCCAHLVFAGFSRLAAQQHRGGLQ